MLRLGSSALVVALLVGSSLAAAVLGPKVSYERRVPARHSLGPVESLALVEGDGSAEWLDHAVAGFTTEASRGFTFTDARHLGVSLDLLAASADRLAEVQESVPADAYAALFFDGCNSHSRSEVREVKEKGVKVKKTFYWVEADCQARVRVLDAEGGELARFTVTEEDKTYPTEQKVYSFQLAAKVLEAARGAGGAAAGGITPGRDKVSIPLDKKAPGFAEGMARIKAGDYPGARAIWERTLGTSPSSAGLHHNLGAVTEAIGDLELARERYQEATRLAPNEAKYRKAREKIDHRIADAAVLRGNARE